MANKTFKLTDNDLDLISELIPVASGELGRLLEQTHKVYPESALNESLRKWIEQAADIRARIEAR